MLRSELSEDRQLQTALRGLMAHYQKKTNFAKVKQNRRARRRRHAH